MPFNLSEKRCRRRLGPSFSSRTDFGHRNQSDARRYRTIGDRFGPAKKAFDEKSYKFSSPFSVTRSCGRSTTPILTHLIRLRSLPPGSPVQYSLGHSGNSSVSKPPLQPFCDVARSAIRNPVPQSSDLLPGNWNLPVEPVTELNRMLLRIEGVMFALGIRAVERWHKTPRFTCDRNDDRCATDKMSEFLGSFRLQRIEFTLTLL